MIAICAAAAFASLPAFAESPAQRLLFHPNLQTDLRPSLAHPMRLGVAGRISAPEPVWTPEGVWATRPAGLWGLATTEASRAPVWDPSVRAWFAWAMGMLVLVEPDGGLPVVLQDLPGHDFDVRAALGLVVYADPNRGEIVLQKLDGDRSKRVLFSNHRFFNPRFSPDGSAIVVSESRSGGGHIWLIPTGGGAARDLGRGNQPVWHPDGKRLLLTTFENDSLRHTSSSLFLLDLATGARQGLGTTTDHIVLRPSFSPDGSAIAFADEKSDDVMLAVLPKGGR